MKVKKCMLVISGVALALDTKEHNWILFGIISTLLLIDIFFVDLTHG